MSRPTMRRVSVSLLCALVAAACEQPSASPEPLPDELEGVTEEASLELPCGTADVCTLGGSADASVFTALYRVGQTATGSSELAQAFVAPTNGRVRSFTIALRRLRAVPSGPAPSLRLRLFGPNVEVASLDPRGSAGLVGEASVALSTITAGARTVLLPEPVTVAGGATYVLAFVPDELPEGANGQLLIGVGAYASATGGSSAWRGARRRAAPSDAWTTSPMRAAGTRPVALGVHLDTRSPIPPTIAPATLFVTNGANAAFTVSGGDAPYVFSMASGGGSISGATYTAPSGSGSAVVRVTDAYDRTSDAQVTFGPPLAISPTTSAVVTGGVAPFTATGGLSPYTFWVASGGGSFSAGTFNAPATPGPVTVRVTDGAGASADASVTVYPPLVVSPASASIAIGNSVELSSSGGFGARAWSVVTGAGSFTGDTFTASQSPGAVTVRATDSLGNRADATVLVAEALAIAPASVTLAVNNTFAFDATGGVPPYVYAVATGGGSFTGTTYAAPASAGTATVRVSDALGNTSLATVTINEALVIAPSGVTLAVTNTQAFSAAGGVPPYAYAVTSGGGTFTGSTYVAPAATGVASVRVTDLRGNTSTASITINAALTISPSAPSVVAGDPVTFNVAGGVAPIALSLVSGGGSLSDNTFTSPGSEGAAVVRASDARGNTAEASITVTPPLSIDPSPAVVTVGDQLVFTSAGGAGTHVFSLLSGVGTLVGATYTAPATPGTAVVRVTDGRGRTADAAVTVNPEFMIDPVSVTLAVGNSFSFGASGGTEPYTFSLVSGGGTITSADGLYVAPASPGTAVVRARESGGETSDATITINAALALSPATSTLPLNGTRTFTATGGAAPYAWRVVSGGGSFSGATYTAPVSAGTVTVRVTDAVGNAQQATITVYDPLGISPSTATMPVNGTLSFLAWGGVPAYTFTRVSGVGSVTGSTYYAPATAGSATVRVSDAAGNQANATITITNSVVMTPSAPNVVVGGNVTFTASSGLAPYTYSLVSGGGSLTGATYDAPATPGAAVVRVTDALGTTFDANVNVYAPPSISPVLPYVMANRSITFTASGGFGAYAFAKTAGTGTLLNATYTAPSTSGTATIRVTDAAGNTSSTTVTVYATLAITPVAPQLLVNGQVTFSASGGYGAYTYSVASGGGSLVGAAYTAPATAGGAVVRVTDAAGNVADAAVSVFASRPPAAGGYNSCEVRADGTLWCWGYNAYGQVGDASVTTRKIPTKVGIATNWSQVAVGLHHACATRSNGTLWCWGRNHYGQVGDNSVTTRNAPVQVGTGTTWSSVAAGYYHSCATRVDGTLWCWGYNAYGQLGDGTTTRQLVPVQSGPETTWTSIKAGTYHSCGLRADRSLWCWGRNASYQLGDGTAANKTSPVQVGSDLNWVEASAGSAHTCGIRSDGTLWCWGSNASGRLGDGTTTTRTTPVRIGTATNWAHVAFASNAQHTCATRTDATLWCWGYNVYGAVGDGTTTARTSPVQIGAGNAWVAPAAGTHHSCARTTAGAVWCWGRNNYGQVGDTTITNRLTPVATQ